MARVQVFVREFPYMTTVGTQDNAVYVCECGWVNAPTREHHAASQALKHSKEPHPSFVLIEAPPFELVKF